MRVMRESKAAAENAMQRSERLDDTTIAQSLHLEALASTSSSWRCAEAKAVQQQLDQKTRTRELIQLLL